MNVNAADTLRKISNEGLLLENMRHVLYDEKIEMKDEDKLSMKEYEDLCNQCLDKLENPDVELIDGKKMKTLMGNDPEKYSLLKTIYETVVPSRAEK